MSPPPDPAIPGILAVVGPTAGGKTDVAIALARAAGGECVCADSMQVYRGMDIGTAKPDAAARAAVPHHLLDVADPAEDGFSVDTWHELAEAAIEDIRRRGRRPVVVGGTNLYVQTLLYGLLEGPAPDPEIRRRLQAESPEALRAWLERVDPVAAARIHPNDRKRTIRAIEVFEVTSRPISEMQTHWASGPAREDVTLIGLQRSVESTNRRINTRVKQMIDAGLVDETRGLLETGLGVQAREALGYKQVIEHLEGGRTLEEAIEQIKIRTRRFAKQQRTWLRRFTAVERSVWYPADEIGTEDIANKALMEIDRRWRPPTRTADEELRPDVPG
jgi:tRNA dimethylallyltransferase